MTSNGQWTQKDETDLSNASENFINSALNLALASSPDDAQSYKDELKQIEKLKNPLDLQRDKELKAQEEQAYFEKTDKGFIKKNIKSIFEKWNQKGEFEKEADYTTRIKTKSLNTFYLTCIEQIKSKIGSYSNTAEYERKLSFYDAENESFNATFKINGVEWQTVIKIPIAKAENFKLKWPELIYKIDEYEWGFVENSLCPTLITLVNYSDNSKYEFPLPLKNQSEIVYTFNEFDLTNQYLKDSVFRYSQAKRIVEELEKERLRLDSLEYENFSQKLDSVFNSCNQTLLQNPYNIAQKAMSSYSKLERTGNRRINFETAATLIRANFEELNKNFEKELENQNPGEYCKVYYSIYPDKKTESDKMYLECRCLYPLRLNFDMDFIKKKVGECDCREKEYQKNGKLFTNKEEFDSFYDKGVLELEEEVTLREFRALASIIEPLDFRDINGTEVSGSQVGKAIDEFTKLINPSSIQKEQQAKELTPKISGYKEKPYYAKIIDFVVTTNKGLTKEWDKNGNVFASKTEFFEAFISGNYKQLLKDKKR